MAPPAAAPPPPVEEGGGGGPPNKKNVDHVLNEDTPSTNMDILVMPGESFTAQPNMDIHKGNCAYHGGLSVLEVCNYGSIHECRPVFGIC